MNLVKEPCLDNGPMADARRQELDIGRVSATALGMRAVAAIDAGHYQLAGDSLVDWSGAVAAAVEAKVSIPPDATLPLGRGPLFDVTRVWVTNETTLSAAYQLVEANRRPLALNMANGVSAGGGFLHGSRAQEEVLCRSSALYATLLDNPMYAFHATNNHYESSDWMILSPDVPVFCTDSGTALKEPWLCSFLTSAAPVAQRVGQPRSAELMRSRISRFLEIAAARNFDTLVLGAWGCGCFREVVFAITDWSPERRFIGPFRDVFKEH